MENLPEINYPNWIQKIVDCLIEISKSWVGPVRLTWLSPLGVASDFTNPENIFTCYIDFLSIKNPDSYLRFVAVKFAKKEIEVNEQNYNLKGFVLSRLDEIFQNTLEELLETAHDTQTS